MSNIMVKIDGIQGEATGGHADEIQCFSMRHAVDLAVFPGAVRVEGSSNHGPLALTHGLDKASPPIRLACCEGTNLGTVGIAFKRMIEGTSETVEEVRLGNARVVRVDLETPLDAGTNDVADEPLETFYLEYSSIEWVANQFQNGMKTGSVAAYYDAYVLQAVGG